MAHAISIDESEIWATRNARLEALKVRYVPTPDNQRRLGDSDLSKIMDRDLYKATKEGDIEKFMDALEKVSRSRELALSLIFDQVTPSGDSLLHVAASSGKKNVVELILVHFPYLATRKNSLEDTPLHVAIQTRSSEATRKLIDLRGDSEIMYWKNKDNKSPLYLAVKICDSWEWENREGAGWDILQLLLDASAPDEAYEKKIQGMSPLSAAIEEDKSDMLRGILDRLPKLLHVRGEDEGTPLHYAASVGNGPAVVFLLERCPDLALQTDKNDSYPIHIACERGNGDIIRQLVQTWPNLAEMKNNKGQNILHVAAEAGNKSKVKSLLKKSSEPDIIEELEISEDAEGNVPCQLAFIRAITPRYLWSTREQSFGANDSSSLKRIRKEIDPLLIVATLVASVTFTAGITLPGGYNTSGDPDPGTPVMLHNLFFQVFIILNAFATYSSILSVLLLLRARIANPRDGILFLGLAERLLSVAITVMTVAFWLSSVAAVSKLKWFAIFFAIFAAFCTFMVNIYANLASFERD